MFLFFCGRCMSAELTGTSRAKESEELKNYSLTLETPIGLLRITASDKAIIAIKPIEVEKNRLLSEDTNELVKKCVQELKEYFAGRRTNFDLPLAPKGTDFQKQVWQALQKIPYGETRTYGKIAQMMGKPKAARAIGMANHNNPILILIPCHRVIGGNGSLTGYAAGIENQKYLLELEKGKNKV